MIPPNISWVHQSTDDTLKICVQLDLYPLTALFRVCYAFTDKCYLFLTTNDGSSIVDVNFARKSDCDLVALAGDFCNELIDQRVRHDIAVETGPIRELIVAQAFAEADLLDRSASEGSYNEDPKEIAR